MSSVYFDAGITDEERRQRLYAGDIFIIPPSDGTRKLIALAAACWKRRSPPTIPERYRST
jgi:hypothetical protein